MIYWKQRATIRWVKFGDERSKFFQENASIKFRNYYIYVLQDQDGLEHSKHQYKAFKLWNAFKDSA